MTMLAEQCPETAVTEHFRHAVEARANDGIFVAERNAAAIEDFLALDAVIGVGYGVASLTRDGHTVYEEHGGEDAGPITVAQAEELAQTFPGHDWCIHLIALLDDRHYRRVGRGCWKLYKRGYGLS